MASEGGRGWWNQWWGGGWGGVKNAAIAIEVLDVWPTRYRQDEDKTEWMWELKGKRDGHMHTHTHADRPVCTGARAGDTQHSKAAAKSQETGWGRDDRDDNCETNQNLRVSSRDRWLQRGRVDQERRRAGAPWRGTLTPMWSFAVLFHRVLFCTLQFTACSRLE